MMQALCRRLRAQVGFTLIETMIALAIIGILAGLAAPSFGRTLQKTYLSNAARQLVADLRETQSEAYTAGAAYEFRLNVPTGYQAFKPGETAPFISVALENGIEIKSVSGITGDKIIYDAYGKPGITGNAAIVLVNRHGVEATVEITPVTGRVRVVP